MVKLFLKCTIFIGFSFFLAGFVTAENSQLIRNQHDQNDKSAKDSSNKSSQEAESNKPKAREFYVNMPDWKVAGNSDFEPKELTVKVGDIVIWTNNDSRTHYVTTMKHNYPGQNLAEGIEDDEEEEEEEDEDHDTFFSSSDINPGETFSYSFTKPGTYKYFCFTHPIEMQGVVIVKE